LLSPFFAGSEDDFSAIAKQYLLAQQRHNEADSRDLNLEQRAKRMELKTSIGDKSVQAKDIDHVLRGKITGRKDTLVKLKTGEEVLLQKSEEEVVAEMNKAKKRYPQ